MALELIHSFTTVGGKDYEIYYDPVTDDIQAVADPLPDDGVVTESDMGVPIGFVFRDFCRLTTRVKVKATIYTPYAVLELHYNSPECGGLPPCDVWIDSIDKTDETVATRHDGTATINASPPGPGLRYSLDGITWQVDNYFYNLAPGTYYGYVRCNESTIDFKVFTIVPGIPLSETLYPWQEKICKFFRLLFPDGMGGYTTVAIREPVKWDNVNFIGKRDKDWHGYRGMFSDGIIELEFDCEAGMEQIVAKYAEDGNDAETLFQYGYTYNAVEYFLFKGKLNYNTYKRFPGKVALSVEKEDFNTLFQSRFDAKVSMDAVQTMDGATLAPPAIIDFVLHAKEIKKRFERISTIPESAGIGYTDTRRFVYRVNTADATLNEIEESFTFPLLISAIEVPANELYNWLVKYDGTYNFYIDYTLQILVHRKSILFGSPEPFTIKSYFQINNNTPVEISTPVSDTIDDGDDYNATIVVHGEFLSQALLAGDKVFFWTEFYSDSIHRYYSNVTCTTMNVRADSLERANDSECKGWLLAEAVNQCLKAITNNTTRLRSWFLQTMGYDQPVDGSGSLYLVTNGKQIRKFDVANAPLKVALKELLNSCKSLFCIGYGFEKYGTTEVVRVERVNYFYRNKEILVIDTVWDYKEEVAKDIILNELEVGYDKYQDSGFNTLDEFNTKHEHLTPIKTHKQKGVMKSSLIASGYSIEESRRKQFDDTATESFQNDDEPFIIAVRRDSINFIPEKDEAFDTVNNLISPATAYNLRISPFRMLLNWAIWLKGIFFYKPGTEIIKDTFVANNGDLITQFKTTEVNPIGDINKLAWQEKQDISLTNYAVEEQIYRPEWIFFKTKLTPDKIQIINESMVGNWDPDTNYGYIVVPDEDGVYQAGFLYELEYNYYTEMAQFKLLKKFDVPVTPGADCCRYLNINGCRILINDDPVTIN